MQISWVLENIEQDNEEETSKITNVFEALKPWMNLQLYQEEYKQKTQKKVINSSFDDELKKRGINPSDVLNIHSIKEDNSQIENIEKDIERDING